MKIYQRVFAMLFSAALLLSTVAAAAEKTYDFKNLGTGESTEIGRYTVTNVGDNVWHLEDCTTENPHGYHYNEQGVKTGTNNCSDMYVVLGDEKAMLVDLSNQYADSYEDVAQIFDELSGGLEQMIWLTHAHPDHVGQFPAFRDRKMPIYVAEDDYDNLDQYSNLGMDKSYVTPFNPEDTIDLGGRVFKCVMVPGHTAGSNMLYESETHIAFPGDAVGSGNSVWLLDSVSDYDVGVHALMSVIDNELNGEIKLYTGHTWQAFVHKEEVIIDRQYVADMCSILDNIKSGGDYSISSRVNMRNMDIYASYGKALISVNRQKLCAWSLENGAPLRVFGDVSGDALTAAVARLYADGVIAGTGLLTFSPDREITGAELIALLARAVKAEIGAAGAENGKDAAANSWYSGYMTWAYAQGLLERDDSLNPLAYLSCGEVNDILTQINQKFEMQISGFQTLDGNATRGEVALLLADGIGV